MMTRLASSLSLFCRMFNPMDGHHLPSFGPTPADVEDMRRMW